MEASVILPEGNTKLMASIEKLDAINFSISRVVAFGGVFGILAIALLLIGDVSLRFFFKSPIIGLNEYVELIFAVALSATFPSAVAMRNHLKIELLAGLNKGLHRWLTVFGSGCLAFLLLIVASQAYFQAQSSFDEGLTSSVHALPYGPFHMAIAAFILVAALSQVVVFVVDAARSNVDQSGRLNWLFPFCLIASVTISMALFFFFDGFANSMTGFAWDNIGILAGAVFFLIWVLLLLFVPIAAVTGLLAVGASSMLIGTAPALSVIGSEAIGFLTNSEVSVLPLFLIMGILAGAAGIADDVFRLAHALLGHLRGGLALASIGGCAGFGAVTGSSIATVATIGGVSLPEMKKRGYSETFSTGSIAAGGTLGALIPPSGALVIYALLTEESIGQLFVAALIPAAIAVTLYLITIFIWVRISPEAGPATSTFSWLRVFQALKQSSAVIFMFAVVMGGIYSGIFTVNEAAAFGAIIAFLIAWFRGALKGKVFWQVMGQAASLTAMIYALIIGGLTMSFFVSTTGLPQLLTDYVFSLGLAPLATIALILVFYILLGAIMEAYAIMIITVPIVSGLITGMGYDLVWWGIIMLVVLEIGQISPPFGMNVFVLKSISGPETKLTQVYKGVLPFLVADLVKLTLLILFPVLSLWLPAMMF